MLKNFGGAYTLSNINDESYIEIQMLQLCLSSSEKAHEFASKKGNSKHYQEFS